MRLIDADALTNRIEADKKQDNISPGNFFLFKAYIMNAPTVEPDGDLISRQDAIGAFYNPKNGGTYAELNDGSEWYMTSKEIYDVLESLPSAEPKTGKNTNANEIYNYLKDRIGDIVDDMKEFDAWFERMVWHVKECNRLTAEPKTGEWVE